MRKEVKYLIKVNDLYYGKENSINGRIIDPKYIEKDLLKYIVYENSYKTKQGAINGANKLQKEKTNAKISIQGLIFEK